MGTYITLYIHKYINIYIYNYTPLFLSLSLFLVYTKHIWSIPSSLSSKASAMLYSLSGDVTMLPLYLSYLLAYSLTHILPIPIIIIADAIIFSVI